MTVRLPHKVALGLGLVAAGVAAGLLFERRASTAKTSLSCSGAYADTLQIASERLRQLEQGPASRFTYLVRNAARYECPYFGPDGKLRRRRVDAREHGTAFAYEVSGGETFLLTNEHVASWPEVTDPRHKVDGVPDGCKRVDEKLHIVHDEKDGYEAGQIPLSLVAEDARLDAAVLKAPTKLVSSPYKVGRSAALRQGNAVQVRGFPLGLIHAVNTGKVVNPYDHDVEQGWDHVDFVIDALLSEGNSGSPVLALSCRSGELELVGMYHAGYKEASALNVVVGIDQLTEFMTKKRRVPRAAGDAPVLGAEDRKRLIDGLAAGALPLFELGGLHALVETEPDRLRYHLYGRGFPLDDRRLAILEDRAQPNTFGAAGQLWVRTEADFRAYRPENLGQDDRDLVAGLAEALRTHALRALDYRRGLAPGASADEKRKGREVARIIERQTSSARELAGALVDLAERLAQSDAPTPDAGAVAAPPPPAISARPVP